MSDSDIPSIGAAAPARSFGRSTFKSSFLGASSLLAKNSASNEELETELQLQSDDDSDEVTNKENISTRPVPSVFLVGATQPTQLDTQLDFHDNISQSETQTQTQTQTQHLALNIQDENSPITNSHSEPMEEETHPDMPVVYASRGRMKVLGALPSAVVSTMVSRGANNASKSKDNKKSSKSKAPPKVHRNIDVEARRNYLAKVAAAAAAEQESATNPQRIKDAVKDLVSQRKEVAKDWTMKQWSEEVCSQLNVVYDAQDLQLRAYVKEAVLSSTELSDMVSSQTQSQEYIETQSQALSQAAIQSQMEELFDGDDKSEDTSEDKADERHERWADADDADDEVEDAVADTNGNISALASLENESDGDVRHWGEDSDEEDVFRSKNDKKSKSKLNTMSKRDKMKAEKIKAKQLRRLEKEQRRRERAEKKAAAALVKEGENGEASGSEASVKAANSESDDDSDVVSSSSSDGDQQEDEPSSDDEGAKKKKIKQKKPEGSSSKVTKPKKSSIPEMLKETAVDSEIAAVKALDQGPSEAELRSRKLVTLDEDERLDLVYRMNQKAALILSKSQRRSVEDECSQLRKIKNWINEKRAGGDEQIIEDILDALKRQEADLSKNYGKKYTHSGSGRYGAVDPIFFLKRDQEDDDEEEHEDLHYVLPEESDDEADDDVGKVATKAAGNASEVVESADMVCLSDSEDEDVVSPIMPLAIAVESTEAVGLFPPVPALQEELTPQPIALQKQESWTLYQQQRGAERERKIRIRQAMLAVRSIKSGTRRTQEKQRLRHQVAVKAEEQYCSRIHISSEYLPVRKQIDKNCRKLVDLLRERADRQQEKQRTREEREAERRRRIGLRRRAQWNLERNADEAEFDETTAAPARVFTEEELQIEQLRLEQEEEEEDYEEEEGDDDDYDAELLAPVDEELEAIKSPGSDNEDMLVDSKESGDESDAEGDDQDGEEQEDEEEAQPRGRKLTKRGVIDDDDDDDNNEAIANAPSSSSGAAPMRRSIPDGVEETETIKGEAFESQSNIELPKEVQKERRKRAGNSMYRQMVEEEERREAQNKKSNFIEDGAEEDEEEGRQKGLNDFGFGTGARDVEDEREALKMRAGDFDNIVDDLSDDERDEADEENAMRMRYEQELKEDKDKNRRIVEGIIDGFDKSKRGRKGQMSFDKLIGDSDNRPDGVDANGEPNEDLDEEEQLQRRLLEGITNREQERRMAGDLPDESDEDPEDDDGEQNDDETLTEEQIATKFAMQERKREERRQEKLRLRNLENAARIERMRRKQMMAQSQTQGAGLSRTISSQSQALSGFSRNFSRKPTLTLTLGIDDDDLMPAPVSLKRSISAISASSSALPTPSTATATVPAAADANAIGSTEINIVVDQPLVTAPAQLEEENTESAAENHFHSAPVAVADTSTATSTEAPSASEDNQSPRLRNVRLCSIYSQFAFSPCPSTESLTPPLDTSFAQITNTIGSDAPAATMTIKRRTGMPPKRIEPKPISRTSTFPASTGNGGLGPGQQNVKRTKTMYSGELNASEVEAGFGMGMAVPAARRKPASDGLFSAVTGLKRVDSGIPSVGGMGMGTGRPVNALKKFRGGSSSTGGAVTVSAQQYVFGATSMTAHDDGSHMASNIGGADSRAASSSGWDNSKATAAMASRMGAPAGGLSKGFPLSRTRLSAGGDEKSSLFAKLHKR